MKKVIIWLIALFLFPCLILPEKKSADELPPQYKRWLEEEVVYIISPLEKDVFLQLETDRERELFIEAFWRHRDPTQGTPENEFKEEHYQRMKYANYHFARGAPMPGWKTDRGKIYIILGEPVSIERFTGETQIYNSEIWFYQGLTKVGLPPGFYLVFYQKDGVGEYVLYSPTSDGPQALMTSYFGDRANDLAAFRALKKISPNLANASLSLIPGESARFGRPSLASDILLQNIYQVPQKELKDKYAEKFLMYKDVVEVDYTANYIDSDASIKVIKDPSGMIFVHYVVELMRFSVQKYKEKYSTLLKINGNVSDMEGKTIYQYEESIPVELDEPELKKITYLPFDLYDMFPLLPGKYQFSVIIKNEVSKEFTSLEEKLTIPEDESSPRMGPLILGYKIEPLSPVSKSLTPFRIGQHQVYHQPKKIFHPKDRLILSFQIFGLSHDLAQEAVLKVQFYKGDELFSDYEKTLNDYPDRVNFKEEFSLEGFPPAHYRIKVTLMKDGREWLAAEEDFDITSVSRIPRPWVYYKQSLPASDPVYDFILGSQLFNKGEIEKARVRFEMAYRERPHSQEYALGLARACFALKMYNEAKQILRPFADLAEAPYQVYFFLGRSYQAIGEFNQAVSVFNQAISHFGINSHVLNALAECYFQMGSLDEALAAWEKSLEISPNQPEIRKKLEAIKK